MDHTESPVSGEPNAAKFVTTNAEHDPLLALRDLFSGVSLDGEVPMSRALASAVDINQLNEYCLLALFDQFSLQEQLQLRAVCSQWQVIIEKKCRQKRSLKIFGDVDDVYDYCQDMMYLNLYGDDRYKLKPVGRDDDLIGSLDQRHLCAYLFADITSLVYEDYDDFSSLAQLSQCPYLFADITKSVYDDYPNTCTILELLPAMFPMLTSLTLGTRGSPFTAIRSLPHLTSLYLHYLDNDTIIPESIPIFHQLKCFSLRLYHGPHIASILSQLGPQLTRLMLSEVSYSAAQLATALTSNPSLAISVTHLTIGDCFFASLDYHTLLDLICTQFTNLVYLHYYSVDLHSLPSLAKLHHLIELHVDQFGIPDEVPRHLPAVPTVKQLHFEFDFIPTPNLNLQTLFPAVEQIAIYSAYDNDLDRARKYMAQFPITCLVTFQKKDYQIYMGRHRQFVK